MSFPTSAYREYLDRFRLSGITVELYPSTVGGLTIELQAATANSTASSMWRSQIVGPTSASVLRYNWPVPYSTKPYYFRARHPAQPGYSAGPFTRTISATPQNFPLKRPFIMVDPRFSHGFAVQGSMLPFVSPQSGTFFNWASGGLGVLQMWASFTWTTQTLRMPDGTTITVPGTPSAPSAPTLSTTVLGALGARNLFARIAYAKTENTQYTLYPVSAESTTAVPANSVLRIASPTNPGNGLYDGWVPLVSNTTNTEYVQGQNDPANIIPFGTSWTEPATGFTTTDSQWTSNWKALTFVGMNPSTSTFHYLFYDVGLNQLRLRTATATRSASHAQLQHSDGMLSLGQYGATQGYSGAINFSTPAAAGSSTGTGGGGRLN